MKRFAKPAAALFVITALIAVGSLMPQPGNAANTTTPQPVVVSNGAGQPVPISGTVSGSVGASQAGSWNVGINNTPTVNVGNFPSTQAVSGAVSISGVPGVNVTNPGNAPVLIRSVDDGARNAIALDGQVNMADGQDTWIIYLQWNGQDFSLPAGKRLEIEDISFTGGLPSGQRVEYCDIEPNTQIDQLSWRTHPVFIQPTNYITDSLGAQTDVFAVNAQLRAFHDAHNGIGAKIQMRCQRNANTGSAQVNATVFGYLVDSN